MTNLNAFTPKFVKLDDMKTNIINGNTNNKPDLIVRLIEYIRALISDEMCSPKNNGIKNAINTMIIVLNFLSNITKKSNFILRNKNVNDVPQLIK